MSVSMVREPSETPNINNTDDFVGLRYAYGNQNGYVKDKGNECSYSVNGSTFHINSGRLVLQGVECDIDANGVNITIDDVSSQRYYSVYLQVNLSTNVVSILSSYGPSSYPTITAGDDLTENSSGTARMELYRFTAINGTISNVSKIVSMLEYINKTTKVNSAVSADSATTAGACTGNAETVTNGVYKNDFNKSSQTKFGNYIIPKKKLISNSTITITTTPTTIIDHLGIFELEISTMPNSSLGGRRFTVNIGPGGGCDLLININIQAPTKTYGVVAIIASGSDIIAVTNNSSTPTTFYIHKIYEIIE